MNTKNTTKQEQTSKHVDGKSALNVGLSVHINQLHISVRGSEGITFEEGWRTGDMTEPGIEIKTVWYENDRRSFGGCINREEAVQIRDFMNQCIEKWEQENMVANE